MLFGTGKLWWSIQIRLTPRRRSAADEWRLLWQEKEAEARVAIALEDKKSAEARAVAALEEQQSLRACEQPRKDGAMWRLFS